MDVTDILLKIIDKHLLSNAEIITLVSAIYGTNNITYISNVGTSAGLDPPTLYANDSVSITPDMTSSITIGNTYYTDWLTQNIIAMPIP